ncbi:unnamed protein product, partial [Tetraodon nigroviridis]
AVLPHLLCQRVGPESPECTARAEDPARRKLHTGKQITAPV